jgi:hypothetical protein
MFERRSHQAKHVANLMMTCEFTVHQDGISKGIFQHYTTRDRAAFNHTTTNYHLPLTRLPENTTNGPPVRVLSIQKNPDKGSRAIGYVSSGKIFSFFNSKNSRPSNFLFQIARGSGAILSECPFSLKKRTSLKNYLEKTTSRFLFERTRIKLVPPDKTRENKKASEFNHETL